MGLPSGTPRLVLAALACATGGCNTLVGIEMPTERMDASRTPEVHESDGSSSVDAARPQVPPGDAAANFICPPAMPAPNEPCTKVGLVCQYGDDARGDACRDTATCSDNGWLTTHHVCPEFPAAKCPATRSDAKDMACTTRFAWCSYDKGLACECTNCSTGQPFDDCGGPLTWHCQEPNPNSLCPITLPNAGTPCAPDGMSCRYRCGPYGARECQDGIWLRNDGVKCPQIPPGGAT
jgi:hypothetical protein